MITTFSFSFVAQISYLLWYHFVLTKKSKFKRKNLFLSFFLYLVISNFALKIVRKEYENIISR